MGSINYSFKKESGIQIVFPIAVELYIAWMGGGRYYFDEDNNEHKRKKKCPLQKIKICSQHIWATARQIKCTSTKKTFKK